MAKVDAEHNLLFGLMALQIGMINQAALVGAFQAWTLAKDRSIAGLLVEQGALTESRRALLEGLVGEHLAMHGGGAEKSLAAVAAGKSTRESLAKIGDPEIAATLGHVASAHGSTDDDVDRTGSYAIGSATSDGQRFRVLRPHARGGLGAVFVALDSELNREVALKQILDHHADDPTSRARFLIEAEITGGLEHPGIVPVYGLGAYRDGRPYYAMRFIKGDSLKEAIEDFHANDSLKNNAGRRSLELHKLLRRFMDVCNAIDYAHSRGVLHRDIKPGNIIVGKHGETLVVDWGLAKPLGRIESGSEADERTLMPSSASGSAETLPGSAMGTPAYMSPEQACGDLHRLGTRSDVYSLGATLYCLLSGKPPFESDDLGEMLRKVQKGHFVRPREGDPSLDKALEAICLKAMANQPEERYSSCRSLAEEVERWMADEPVTAYREPFSQRTRRWAKRNRTAFTAALVALLAGVLGLSAVIAVQTRANAQLSASLTRETLAKSALALANDELKTANGAVKARYDLAVDAIQTFHTGVSEDFLLKQNQFKDLRDRLLKSAGDFYGKLGALLGKETLFSSRRALAQTNFELADLTAKVGRLEDALAAHHAVLAARKALAAEPEADPAVNVEVGQSATAVASLFESTGKTDQALSAYREAEALLMNLPPSEPATAGRAALANCRSRMGAYLAATGKIDQALAAYRLARSDQEALAEAPEAAKEYQLDLASTIHRIAVLLMRTGKRGEAEAEFRKAIAINQKLADNFPRVDNFRASLALNHNHLGSLLLDMGRAAEAEPELRNALTIQQKLSQDNPAVNEFRGKLGVYHNNLGNLLLNSRKPAEAEAEYRKALAIQRKLADDYPAVSDFRHSLAGSHQNHGVSLIGLGKLAEALAEFDEALAIDQKVADDNPAVTAYRFGLAQSRTNFGKLLSTTGNRSRAEAEFRKALAIFQKLADDNPAVADFILGLAGCHQTLGILLWDNAKPDKSEAEYRQALVILQKRVDDNSAVISVRKTLADFHNDLGGRLRNSGRPITAAAEFDAEIGIRRELYRLGPEMANARSRLAIAYYAEGLCWESAGDRGRAVECHREAARMDGEKLGLAIFELGRLLSELGRHDEAIETYRRAIKIFPKDHRAPSALPWALLRAGRSAEAVEAAWSAAGMLEHLVTANPDKLEYRAELAYALSHLGDALRASSKYNEARAGLDRAISIEEALIHRDPRVTAYRGNLARNLLRRGLVRRDLNDLARAASDIRQALAIWAGMPSRSAGEWFETACGHAALAGVAGREGSGVPTDAASTEANEAVSLLAKSISSGFRDATQFRIDDTLEPLRDRPDFRLLMLDLAMPAYPFAP